MKYDTSGVIEELDEIQLDELETVPIEDDNIGIPDEVMEVNLREKLYPQNTFVSKILQDEERE